MKNIAILDEYLVDHCWIVTCDHHLHGPLLLQWLLSNKIHCPPRFSGSCLWHKAMTICRRQIVQKCHFDPPPIWRPIKISPPNVEKPTSGTELYSTIMQIFPPIGPRCPSPGKKYIFAPYRRPLWRATVPYYSSGSKGGRTRRAPPLIFGRGKNFLKYLLFTKQDSDLLRNSINFWASLNRFGPEAVSI